MMTSENNQYAPQRPVHEEQIPPLSEYARAIIKRHDLVPHPEGGWYSRTWQSPLEYKNSTNITTDTNKGYIATFAAQTLIRAGQWQRTLPAENDVLVSCVVSPGFTFEGFTVISE